MNVVPILRWIRQGYDYSVFDGEFAGLRYAIRVPFSKILRPSTELGRQGIEHWFEQRSDSHRHKQLGSTQKATPHLEYIVSAQ